MESHNTKTKLQNDIIMRAEWTIMQFTKNQSIESWNKLIEFFDRFEKTVQNQMRVIIGSRESKNTKNYTGSLFLKSYIQSTCQQAKKFTQELKVQSIYNIIHLQPTRNPLHPVEYHL